MLQSVRSHGVILLDQIMVAKKCPQLASFFITDLSRVQRYWVLTEILFGESEELIDEGEEVELSFVDEDNKRGSLASSISRVNHLLNAT